MNTNLLYVLLAFAVGLAIGMTIAVIIAMNVLMLDQIIYPAGIVWA